MCKLCVNCLHSVWVMESLWTILYIMRALCVHYARICEVDTLCVNCEHVVYVICTLRTVVCSLYT